MFATLQIFIQRKRGWLAEKAFATKMGKPGLTSPGSMQNTCSSMNL